VVVYAKKLGPAMIDVIFSLPQIEVEDVDGDDLTDPGVVFGCGQVLGKGLGGGEQNPLQKVEFPLVLDLDEEDFPVLIADLEDAAVLFE